MSAHPPPVPPANQSTKGGGRHGQAEPGKVPAHQTPDNTAEQGETANVRQNTTHPGMQQDR